MTIGARLREERERLGLSQPKFAAIAGTTKQTLFSWETGKTGPDCFQMALLAEAGVDVLYVLAGSNRTTLSDLPGGGLPPDEQLLLEAYRGLSTAARKALLAELLTGGKPKKPARAKPVEGGGVTVSGDGNHVAGRDINRRKE